MTTESHTSTPRPHRALWLAAIALILATTLTNARADDLGDGLLEIQHRWAEINYRTEGKAQKKAFEELLVDARQFAAAHSGKAEALIWRGIIASSYAGVKGPFGAMSLAKEARDALKAAEAIDAAALDGSVYTSLGVLYHKVPGGIIGFGDDELAARYLKKALETNPEGIDPNFFYGEYLADEGEYVAAREALLKALEAPSRPDRPLADEGRRQEITALLDNVNRKLDKRT